MRIVIYRSELLPEPEEDPGMIILPLKIRRCVPGTVCQVGYINQDPRFQIPLLFLLKKREGPMASTLPPTRGDMVLISAFPFEFSTLFNLPPAVPDDRTEFIFPTLFLDTLDQFVPCSYHVKFPRFD